MAMHHHLLEISSEQLQQLVELIDQNQRIEAIQFIAEDTPLNQIQALRVLEVIQAERDTILETHAAAIASQPKPEPEPEPEPELIIEEVPDPVIEQSFKTTSNPAAVFSTESLAENTPAYAHQTPNSHAVSNVVDQIQTDHHKNLILIGIAIAVVIALLIWALS